MIDGDLRELISPLDIEKRVAELGREISDHYGDEPVVIIGVLKGAFVFMADLVRRLRFSPIIEFVRLSSYGEGTTSQGKVRFHLDIETRIEDKHVLVVEDIVDTGRSMVYLREVLLLRNPKSYRLCSFLDKRERREVDVHVDFAGFTVDHGFVLGYGLDYGERYRELPGVYVLEK